MFALYLADPTPSITATSYSVSVNENLPAGLNVMPFTVSADKFAIGQKAIVSAHIISGKHSLHLTVLSVYVVYFASFGTRFLRIGR